MHIFIHLAWPLMVAVIVFLAVMVVWQTMKERSPERSDSARVLRGFYLALLFVGGCIVVDIIAITSLGTNASKSFTHVQQQPVAKLDVQAERSWPMFGGGPGRNMVNATARNVPGDWCVEDNKHTNVRWMAELGNQTFGSPVVAHGKIFVTTNNVRPRDPNVKGPKAVLMAFREADGQFLWQIAHDLPGHWQDRPGSTGGLCSTPTLADGKLYYLTPACEVVCADADHGTIQWRYDLTKDLQVHPYRDWCGGRVAPPLASPLVIGALVFVVTGNGRDDEGKLVAPGAPSFVALDKRTGKLAWQSNLPGENIIEGQWACPAFAEHGGRRQVIFAGGDYTIYSFAPETGQLLWKCACLPVPLKKSMHAIDLRNAATPVAYGVGTPVVHGDKLYVGLGLLPESPAGSRWSYFLCLDITLTGDVSLKSYDAKAMVNKGSALVWAFGGPMEPPSAKGRKAYFNHSLSSAAVHEGLVYITEELGYLHCLDAATGKRFWEYDFKSLPGSPSWVDGRVFVGTEDGEVGIFAHGRTAQLLAKIAMEDVIYTTPVAVGDTLYVATRSKLYAIGTR